MKEFRKISVIGLGLIASSICLTLRQKDPTIKLVGYDKDKVVRNRAKKIGLCKVESNLDNAVSGSQLIILCVPVGQMQAVTQRLKQVIAKADNQTSFDRVDMVGPKVSGGFAELSILALLIAGSGMLIYLWGRFEAHFATAALLTVLLDLTKTIGFFALTGIEFNLTAVAALLALIGYSINDKVVVLDRVRELLRGHPEARLAETINQAVNSTLSRTVFTSLTTLLALLPMAIFGGDAVKSFAQPMLFAVVIGTSSSLFITPALLFGLAKRRERLGKAQLKPTAEEIQAELAHIP